MPDHPFFDPQVKAVFDAYPQGVRRDLLSLRSLILSTAAATPGVGELQETLKWRQPAYLPKTSCVGTTLRIDQLKTQPDGFALFVHCQTSLAADIREAWPGLFRMEGDRALLFRVGDALPEEPLRHVVSMALSYHIRRRKGAQPSLRGS